MWHVFCGSHRALPQNPFPSHLITVCQPLTRVGGYPLLNHKQCLPKDQTLPTNLPFSLLSQINSPDCLQHCNSCSFPSLLCTPPVDPSDNMSMTSFPFPQQAFPTEHASHAGQKSRQHSANIL